MNTHKRAPLFLFIGLMFCALIITPLTAQADAIMRSQAMLANTIAEIYVEETGMIVELEIGTADLPAFKNLLPDAIYSDLGYGEEPLIARLKQFSEQDLRFIATDANGNQQPLLGLITEIRPDERLQRDPVTGETIPSKEGENEAVIRVRLLYAFDSPPANLFFGTGPALTRVAVGFVLYHKAIAVNDFRYISNSQLLTLDWNDPWYSSFNIRALRRSYSAPMSGFIYVEPYEVRKEIILRPKDLQHWIDLGLADKKIIPAEDQVELRRKVGEFLREHHPVLIDGAVIVPELARVNFLERTLTSSRVIDPPVDLNIDAAVIGAIFVYPTVEPLPQTVTMEWDLFNDRIQKVPASSVDQAGPLPTFLEPGYAILEWQNFLKNPKLPELTVLSTPPTNTQRTAAYMRWVLLVLSLTLIWNWVRHRKLPTPKGRAGLTAASGLALTALTFWIGSAASLSKEASTEIVGGLLHNIYRAFDFRDESQIYDVLDQSVTGDLLTNIYLETRRGLVLENQGGARAKVQNIELIDLSSKLDSSGALQADVTWRVDGSVGHWGHVHKRNNQYEAQLTITPIAGIWKLTRLEILNEERL
jgi:hypothetical protein